MSIGLKSHTFLLQKKSNIHEPRQTSKSYPHASAGHRKNLRWALMCHCASNGVFLWRSPESPPQCRAPLTAFFKHQVPMRPAHQCKLHKDLQLLTRNIKRMTFSRCESLFKGCTLTKSGSPSETRDCWRRDLSCVITRVNLQLYLGLAS